MSEELGKVHVLTGRGKGKTTAAFGLAMRAAGHGLKVCIVQFMKAGETSGEVVSARRLGNIDVAQYGSGSFVDSKHITNEDKEKAREGLEHAKRVLSDGSYQLVVLDEVNTVVSFGLLSADEVMGALRSRGRGVEVVLTGRNAPVEFIEYADYVSMIESKKHPFDAGLIAREGIEW
ncbi:MAG: cob(I)yrinic acid a,c-diamide adenosyltransferase [Thermoplasmatota archaeon]|nr:cob(I)yrinic acid a,c-diamide adenosyltransferase [Candidatus Thermoplasmatota archaeon]MBU1915075.1 cob(I)yrinic acid a,c-diamide adenosyltransferase [Candidatus Thermoplasmatota archaeon]